MQGHDEYRTNSKAIDVKDEPEIMGAWNGQGIFLSKGPTPFNVEFEPSIGWQSKKTQCF